MFIDQYFKLYSINNLCIFSTMFCDSLISSTHVSFFIMIKRYHMLVNSFNYEILIYQSVVNNDYI